MLLLVLTQKCELLLSIGKECNDLLCPFKCIAEPWVQGFRVQNIFDKELYPMRIARDKEGMVVSGLVLQFSPKRSHGRTRVSREAINEYFVTKAKFRDDSRLNEFDKPIGVNIIGWQLRGFIEENP